MHERVLSWLEGVAESGATIDLSRLATSSGHAVPLDAVDPWRLNSLLLSLNQAEGGRRGPDASTASRRGGEAFDAGAVTELGGSGEAKREIARLGQMVANRNKQIVDAKVHIDQLKHQLQNRDETIQALREQVRTGKPGTASAKSADMKPVVAVPQPAVAPTVRVSKPVTTSPPPASRPIAAAPQVPKPAGAALRLRFEGSSSIDARLEGTSVLQQVLINAEFAIDRDLIDMEARTFKVSDTSPPMLFALGPLAAYLKGPTTLRLKTGSDHRDVELVNGAGRVCMAISAGAASSLVSIDDGRGALHEFKTGTLNIDRDLVLGGGYLKRRWLGTIGSFEIRDVAGSNPDPARWSASVGHVIFRFDGADVTAGKRL